MGAFRLLRLIAVAYYFYRSVPWESAETSTAFNLCSNGSQVNCVIDGNTIKLNGERIKIWDIDAPEVFSPVCERERAIGEKATRELLHLLNDSRFSVARYGLEDRDVYGRKLRAIERNGRSIGDALVAKGLGRARNNPERDWCD